MRHLLSAARDMTRPTCPRAVPPSPSAGWDTVPDLRRVLKTVPPIVAWCVVVATSSLSVAAGATTVMNAAAASPMQINHHWLAFQKIDVFTQGHEVRRLAGYGAFVTS